MPRLHRLMKSNRLITRAVGPGFCIARRAALLLDSPSNPVNDPPRSLATIRNEIEKLEPAEKASLIDLLWDSLDDDRIQKVEAKWAAESEERIDAFERGELGAVDGPSAIEELGSSIRQEQSAKADD
jgi:putative addiction module component (TIGR02574 family)